MPAVYGLKRGMHGVTMKRGPLESTSQMRSTSMGSEATIMDVPWFRVFMHWAFPRLDTPTGTSTGLYGDHENEVTAMLHDLAFDYDKPNR